MKRYSIPRSRRIKAARDFARIYEARTRAGDAHLLVYAATNAVGYPRFGVSVSRKLGPSVTRSHLKRLLREAFRLSQHDLPNGLDLILIPQRGRTESSQLADFQRSLVDLSRRLAKRIGVAQT